MNRTDDLNFTGPVLPQCHDGPENAGYNYKQCSGEFCWCVKDGTVEMDSLTFKAFELICTSEGKFSYLLITLRRVNEVVMFGRYAKLG